MIPAWAGQIQYRLSCVLQKPDDGVFVKWLTLMAWMNYCHQLFPCYLTLGACCLLLSPALRGLVFSLTLAQDISLPPCLAGHDSVGVEFTLLGLTFVPDAIPCLLTHSQITLHELAVYMQSLGCKSWIALWGWMQLSLSVSVHRLLHDLTSWCCLASFFSFFVPPASTQIIKEIRKVQSGKGGRPASQASSLFFVSFAELFIQTVPPLSPASHCISCHLLALLLHPSPLYILFASPQLSACSSTVHLVSLEWLLKASPSVVRSSFSPSILLPAAAQRGWTISRRRPLTVWAMVEDYEKKETCTRTFLLQTAALTQWDSGRISMHAVVWICMINLQVVDLNVLLRSPVRIIVF